VRAPDQKLKPSMLLQEELKSKSSRPWKNDSLLPSSAPRARRYPPPKDDVSASSFTSALIAATEEPAPGPSSSLAVSHEPGGEYDDAYSGDAAAAGFPVSRWTTSRKCRASVLMISGARTCTILTFRGGACMAMAWESLWGEIPDDVDDAPARDGSFAACFMASPVRGARCARLPGLWSVERDASEDDGGGGAYEWRERWGGFYRHSGGFEPLDLWMRRPLVHHHSVAVSVIWSVSKSNNGTFFEFAELMFMFMQKDMHKCLMCGVTEISQLIAMLLNCQTLSRSGMQKLRER
jgi:hypothetical protein